MKRHKTREEIIAEIKQAKADKHLIIGGRVSLAISIAVLWDEFDFSQEDIDRFIDKCTEYLDSYNRGDERDYPIMEKIKEIIGVDLLGDAFDKWNGGKQ